MYCPNCGKEMDLAVKFCPNCGTQVSSGFAAGSGSTGAQYAAAAYPQRKLMRPRHPRMIAGVCSAFALQFGWDLTLVRVITAALAVLTSGAVVLAYLVAWVIIPEASYALPGGAVYGTTAPPPPGTASAPTPPPPTGSTAA